MLIMLIKVISKYCIVNQMKSVYEKVNKISKNIMYKKVFDKMKIVRS